MLSVVSRSAEEASEDDDNSSANDGEADDCQPGPYRFRVGDSDGWRVLGLVLIAGPQGQNDPE